MNKFVQICITSAVLYSVTHIPIARADDMSDVQAASAAFYQSLATLDDGTAMSKVFAQTPYVTFVGPRGKDIIVGWPALKGYFVKANAMFKKRDTKLVDSFLHVTGTLA